MLSKILCRISRFHNTDPKKLQSISAKPFFKHYKQAINFSVENKLNQSNQQFNKCLYEIKRSKQNQLEHYSYIMRRMADNYRRMGQMKNGEEKLYEVIKAKRQSNTNQVILYDDYDRLFRFMITYDLQKATKLCKALLLKQKQQMPIYHTKLFNFNLANAYLLSGNYKDAIAKYTKCLDQDPQSKIKIYVYNNMGLAFWWMKNPLQVKREILQKEEVEKIQKYFGQAKDLFAKSIQIAENQNSDGDQLHKLAIKQALDFKHGSFDQKLQFNSANSLHGLKNLAYFYLANDPLQKMQILYWLKKSLNLAHKTKNQKQFDHLYTQYCVLTNNAQQLKSKLPVLIDKYKYSQNFIEERFYNDLLGRILLKEDQSKAEEYLKRAELIRAVLPNWSEKLQYVAMDELDLTS